MATGTGALPVPTSGGSGSDRNVSLAHGLQLYDEIVRAHAPSYASASTALTAGTATRSS